MREIKFKGKTDSGKWCFGYFLHDRQRGRFVITDGLLEINRVNPDTVGQYTGLKDKNDKEIYDGDILAHNGEPIGYIVDGVRGYCFDVMYFSPIYEESWSLYGVVVNDFHGDVEIIGNIHDPEWQRKLNLKDK